MFTQLRLLLVLDLVLDLEDLVLVLLLVLLLDLETIYEFYHLCIHSAGFETFHQLFIM